MLQAGTTKLVSFKVDILGTQAPPQTVRVVLGGEPELSFNATKAGDEWQANLEIPEDLSGQVNLRVEVVINNRLFTPITKSIAIEPAPVKTVEPASVEMPASKEPAPAEVPAPAVITKQPVLLKSAPKPSIIKQFEADQVASFSALEKLAKAIPKKNYESFHSGMPSSYKSVSEKIKVRIADIDSLAVHTPVSEQKISPKPTKSVARLLGSPTKLIKGAVTYE